MLVRGRPAELFIWVVQLHHDPHAVIDELAGDVADRVRLAGHEPLYGLVGGEGRRRQDASEILSVPVDNEARGVIAEDQANEGLAGLAPRVAIERNDALCGAPEAPLLQVDLRELGWAELHLPVGVHDHDQVPAPGRTRERQHHEQRQERPGYPH